MRRKNPARKSAKKSGSPKIKIREKSVLPGAGPNRLIRKFIRILWGFQILLWPGPCNGHSDRTRVQKVTRIASRESQGFVNRDFQTSQKNPRVRKIRVRNSGAGNGCANFMDALKKCLLSAGKTMPVIILLFGGGECRFYFYGRADFSELLVRDCRLNGG